MAHAAASKLPAGTSHGEAIEADSGGVAKVVAVMLGVAIGVLIPIAVWLAVSAHEARDDARAAVAQAEPAPSAMSRDAASDAGALPTASFAGMAPANAAEIAAAYEAVPAELPALTPGPVVDVRLGIGHEVVQIAPGVSYQAWTFGNGAPGPAIHVREGQQVRVTLTNESPMPHSVDFHAARIAPNAAFVDVAPGESFTFTFTAEDPGVYMYHCGTKPVLAHIANGMYGAIVVEPAAGTLPKADRQYVLVSSEWYLNGPGLDEPAGLDMVKAHNMTPDWVTWNGYAGQYAAHPLTALPGETVRFWVVAAGPSLDTDFHVVGTLLNRAWVNQDMTQFQRNVQTATVAAGGGGVFDVEIDEPGLYPVVSHSFASVDLGQVGLLQVGDVSGSMSH